MKMLLFAGLLLIVLGVASLVVPIPRSETEGIKIGTQRSACTPVTVSGYRRSSARC